MLGRELEWRREQMARAHRAFGTAWIRRLLRREPPAPDIRTWNDVPADEDLEERTS